MVGLPVMVLKSKMNTIISMVLAVMRLVRGTIIEIERDRELSESSRLVLVQSIRIAFVV